LPISHRRRGRAKPAMLRVVVRSVVVALRPCPLLSLMRDSLYLSWCLVVALFSPGPCLHVSIVVMLSVSTRSSSPSMPTT
jgi:hypothetical protein